MYKTRETEKIKSCPFICDFTTEKYKVKKYLKFRKVTTILK